MRGLGSEPARWTRQVHYSSLELTEYRLNEASTRPPQAGSRVEECMLIYEYRCRDCHHVFDRVEPLAEHGTKFPQCPKCHGRHVEQVFTPFFAKTSHKT